MYGIDQLQLIFIYVNLFFLRVFLSVYAKTLKKNLCFITLASLMEMLTLYRENNL